MLNKKEKHEFAIYYFDLPKNCNINDNLLISDDQIYHRIVRVLRAQINQEIILFDNYNNILAKVISIDKKEIKLNIIKINKNKEFKTRITIYLSLLKKESMHEAVYFCSELGASVIQPIITDKSQHKAIDKEKLDKIIISAAEQSKNFNLPELKEPILFKDLLEQNNNKNILKIYFDPKGQKLIDVINNIKSESYGEIYLMIGPEADLTQTEKNMLKKHNFIFCALTPTIIRAHIAVAVSLGIFRSIFG